MSVSNIGMYWRCDDLKWRTNILCFLKEKRYMSKLDDRSLQTDTTTNT